MNRTTLARTLAPALLGLGLGLGLAGCLDEAADDQAAKAPAAGAGGGTAVTVVASGRAAGGEAPRIALFADGRPVGEAVVAASRERDEWGRYAFALPPGPPPKVLAVRFRNDAGERDLWVREVVLAGGEEGAGGDATLRPEQATYLRDGREPVPGRRRMPWAGELRFERP